MGKPTERTGLIKLHRLGWKLCDYSGYLRAEDDPEDEYYVLKFNRWSDYVTLWLANSHGTKAAKQADFLLYSGLESHIIGISMAELNAFRYLLNRLDGLTPKEAYELVEKANEELSNMPGW